MIERLLDRPIAFHRCFVDLTGSVTAALLLSQTVYWHGRATLADNWFYKTAEEWKEETGMGRYELESARKALRTQGLIEETRRGVPAKLHFRLCMDILQTRLLETSKLECGKPANLIAGNQQRNTENTAENTSETTALLFDIPVQHSSFSPEDIYQAYPKKVGKELALASIKKALRKISAPELLEATLAYAAARKGEDTQFTCHPATWFNQGRFWDDRSTWKSPPKTNGDSQLSQPPKPKQTVNIRDEQERRRNQNK